MDFKQWWAAAEIFAGEGAMDAAEQAWDAAKENEWINVEEALPEVGVRVWLYCPEDLQQEGYFVETIMYDDGPAHIFKNMYDDYILVTHWKPLPLPPKE